jgi:hypothetical protein
MTIGVAEAKVEVLSMMLLVVALFVLMNVTLERLIGSWLERLLARRRTREIFFALFILSMVSLQFTSPLFNRYGITVGVGPWVRTILPYFAPFPSSLAGRAVASAATHHFGGALVGLAGLSLYVLLFGGLLWLRFAAQYRGEELSESAAPSHVTARAVKKESGSDALGLLSPQVAAVVRKEFRYLTRNGFSFFLLIMPPAFVLLFSSQFAMKHPIATDRPVSADLFFPAMMGYLILILMGQAYNSFAYEGRGIQAYFTAPLKFRSVFLGKNLMLVAVLALELTLSISAFAYLVGLPSAPVFFATLAAIVFVVVGQLSIANWSSLSFPRKLVFGQMRGQRQSGMAVLVAFGAQVLLGGISAPILFLGRWTGNRWLPAEAFALLAGAALAGYFASLDALTDLAEKKKEVLIEALCR